MNTYAGLHARHYDLIYAEKPYDREARIVADLLAAEGVEGGELLDVACGTGRHAAEFASLGFDVTGVDYSPDLLAVAREREGIEFVEQDMRELDLGGRRFDAVTCLFDSIGYPGDSDGIVAALDGIRRHLRPDTGRAVIEYFHAAALIAYHSPIRVRRWDKGDGGTLLRVSETELDLQKQLLQARFELLDLNADGTYERVVETQSNRFFRVEEMRGLLALASLEAVQMLPAYEEGDAIGETTFHVLAVCREASR